MSVKITPMVQQYHSIKKEYPDALLFYRMGDFYEMFFEDAEIASRILDITLTSRNKKDDIPIPMCGVPYHAAQRYIARLIENGYKVAVCEQVEDPRQAKGLVKRDVVRVVTPGVVIDTELLDAKSNNFIMALFRYKGYFGLACLDISTGDFRVTESDSFSAVIDESLRIDPSEVLIPGSIREDSEIKALLSYFNERTVTLLDDPLFELDRAQTTLLKQFNTHSLEGFGCDEMHAGISAAGALLQYIHETQKGIVPHVNHIVAYFLADYIVLDDTTKRNLELFETIRTRSRTGTLLWVLDKTMTSMGGRMIRQWLNYPLLDAERLRLRLDAVEEAKENITLRGALREALSGIYDLERLNSKIVLAHSNARDLIALKRSVRKIPEIRTLIETFQSDLLRQIQIELDDLADVGDMIEESICDDPPHTINEGGMIKPGYNSDLDEIVSVCKGGKKWIASLEAKERETTGIGSLKVGFNKVFGYYIEVSRTHIKSVPPYYVRKQTLVNAERYITEDLKRYETKVLTAEERRAALEYELFNGIRGKIVQNNPRIQKTATLLAKLDVLCSLAEVADKNGYVKPRIKEDGILFMEDVRHPVIEKMMAGERFVPNTIKMDDEDRQVLIVTGPNMAGKSTILRQVALVVLMAQVGSFVPAESASLSIVDRIFTRVGALDNLAQGESTFMVEMQETARILNTATEKSLIILDEIGRGTSTFDGLSIAWAVAEYLHDWKGRGIKTIFATHYHELTDLAATKFRVKNYNVAVREWNGEIIFLRKLIEGGTNRSYGIQVARLAGIPKDVVERAKEVLKNIETGELNEEGEPNIARSKKRPKKHADVQFTLFKTYNQALVDKLEQINVSNTTPLEALNLLNELKQMV
ncbi:MAG: DNA mismatch repair protein MutS [Pseudomonadota bacterium]